MHEYSSPGQMFGISSLSSTIFLRFEMRRLKVITTHRDIGQTFLGRDSPGSGNTQSRPTLTQRSHFGSGLVLSTTHYRGLLSIRISPQGVSMEFTDPFAMVLAFCARIQILTFRWRSTFSHAFGRILRSANERARSNPRIGA